MHMCWNIEYRISEACVHARIKGSAVISNFVVSWRVGDVMIPGVTWI